MDRPCTGQAKFISSCSAMTDLYDKWRQSIVWWTHKTPYQSNCQIVYIAGGYNETHKSKSHTSLPSDTPSPINYEEQLSLSWIKHVKWLGYQLGNHFIVVTPSIRTSQPRDWSSQFETKMRLTMQGKCWIRHAGDHSGWYLSLSAQMQCRICYTTHCMIYPFIYRAPFYT